jgi:purine-binding chemotaxis protein CheW
MTAQATAPAPDAFADGHRAVGEGGRYLTFTLHGEVYALDILEVTEIIEFRALTVVPMMPPFVRGVINLRGRVLPVVDLAARFGIGATEVAKRTGIVVVEAPAGTDGGVQDVGIMVDAVNKVVHLGADDIEPPPAFGAGIRSDFIAGMARHDGGFVIVLDVGHVLSQDEMVALGRAAVEARGHLSGEPGA